MQNKTVRNCPAMTFPKEKTGIPIPLIPTYPTYQAYMTYRPNKTGKTGHCQLPDYQ